MTEIFNAGYWEARYKAGETGWDTGSATPPITHYFDGLADKQAKILIPGCGRGHEAAYLWKQGFERVYICDWAAQPLKAFAQRYPDFPKNQLLQRNFFELEEADFDFMVEQTFFCALPPALRPQYAAKSANLLRKGGQLVGLLFSFPLTEQGPPFGGHAAAYFQNFEAHFEECCIEACYNSIPPRQGNEYFIQMRK